MQVFLTVPSASLFLGTVPNYFSAYSLLKYVLSIFTHIFDAEMGCALSQMQQSYQTRNWKGGVTPCFLEICVKSISMGRLCSFDFKPAHQLSYSLLLLARVWVSNSALTDPCLRATWLVETNVCIEKKVKQPIRPELSMSGIRSKIIYDTRLIDKQTLIDFLVRCRSGFGNLAQLCLQVNCQHWD